MFRATLFSCLSVLVFALQANATDFIGTVKISTTSYARHGTLPLAGSSLVIKPNLALFSVVDTQWNDVECLASAWEFAEREDAPVGCPNNYTLPGAGNPRDFFRLPPLQTEADWRGRHSNKTVPLQFLNDYEVDFSDFQFTVLTVGAYPSMYPPSENYARTAFAGITIGDILLFTGKIMPYGYLPADGRSVSKSEYPELYRAIGDHYTNEVSAEQNTFELPLLSRAVIYHDGAYKEIIPIIRAAIDSIAPHEYYIGDVIISANPNRPLKLDGEREDYNRFSPIDAKKRTVQLQRYTPLYALIGNKFGPGGNDGLVHLPQIKRKADAADVDPVYFYLVLNGLYPLQP